MAAKKYGLNIKYIKIDDSYNLDFSTSYNTYGSLLKSTFHLIEETDMPPLLRAARESFIILPFAIASTILSLSKF